MNYVMIQREIKTLSEDLLQLAEGIIGPEPPETMPGESPRPRIALAQEEVRRQLNYVKAKLEAVINLSNL